MTKQSENPDSNPIEFDGIRMQAGHNSSTLPHAAFNSCAPGEHE